MKIYFVTTNQYKFDKFTQAIDAPGIEIEQLAEETPEIQADSNKRIAEFSAWSLAHKYNLPILKEDVGMYIRSLNGFPGPYINQVEKWIGTAGFMQLLLRKKDRRAYWEYAIAFCEPGKKAKTFITKSKGTIALEARGNNGWRADKIFVPERQDKTIAELLDENKYIRNEHHYKKMIKFLTKKYVTRP